MEQSDACEAHGNVILVAGLDDIIIPDGTARLCDISHTASVCSLHIVAKWEECI